MKTASQLLSLQPISPTSRFLIVFTIAVAAITTGCGSTGMSSSKTPALSGNTSVTLLLSSTANAQLDQFVVGFNSVTLTSQSGKMVSLFTTPPKGTPRIAEFIHLNGSVEPLLTVSVPQDIYTSAIAEIGPATFTCDALTPSGSLSTDTFAFDALPPGQVTVNLPAPITITGAAMGISLNMKVSQSASYPSTCYFTGIPAYAITPTFNLTPVSFSTPVTEPLLDGQIASVMTTGNGFNVALADGQTVSVNTNSSTVYQGINGFSLLTPGMLIDMDAAIQSDGSQLATRIAVQDSDTANLSASSGPILQIAASQPTLFGFEREHQGYLTTSRQAAIFLPYNLGSVVFHISGSFTNLADLPFVASFDGTSMFDGQNVYVTSHAITLSGGPTYVPATTITLMPQTINATVAAVGTDGAFSTYTVALAPYDLIPDLAVQAGQTTVLNQPGMVVVYVDSKTQQHNTKPLGVGSVLRFNGLLFNDNGALRMDCGQMNDGVTE
jgi:Domain of unknown function (DUF5666)